MFLYFLAQSGGDAWLWTQLIYDVANETEV